MFENHKWCNVVESIVVSIRRCKTRNNKLTGGRQEQLQLQRQCKVFFCFILKLTHSMQSACVDCVITRCLNTNKNINKK